MKISGLRFTAALILWGFVTFHGVSFAAEKWQPVLREILTDPALATDQKLQGIAVDAGDWRQVYQEIQNIRPAALPSAEPLVEAQNLCTDGVSRPYITVVPEGYSPEKSWPLIVYLHGGVSRKDIMEDRVDYVTKCPFVPFAKANGYLMVFPFGQYEAAWWDDAGMANIMTVLKKTKQQYNVDDDRVFMTGFSDGASASYLFAMTQPDSFAGFVPLNGHMGVGALDGKLPTYAENMSVTPMHVINTDIDPLYPGELIRPMIRMAQNVDDDLMYREYHGIGHDFDYAAAELPVIFRFFDRHPRDPVPPKLNWRSANREFGRCRWLIINRVSIDPPEPWHEDANASLKDDRVSFGFFPDEAYSGKGVKIGKLLDGATFSHAIGLQEGDVIIRCNALDIKQMDDLDTFKSGVHRGDHVSVMVTRGEETVALQGNLPDPVTYFLFPREQPSAAVYTQFTANTFEIDSSRLDAFTLLIHPDMVQLDQPVTVIWNGEIVFQHTILPDIPFMIREFLDHWDRKNLFVQRLEFSR